MEANSDVLLLRESVDLGLQYLLQLTSVDEEELFKICLEFWHWFSNNVMTKLRGDQSSQAVPQIPGMDFQFAANSREKVSLQSANSWLYQNVYPKVFDSCHVLMFDNFAKPDEVRLTQDENGEIEEEYYEDLENTFLFERMRETLIYMTHIDMKAMGRFIHLRLQNIKNPEYFSMERLNKLCWALGSISGCMPEDDENAFVVGVIKELLNMCEHAKGKS